jgi:hypothetical protein
MSVRSDISISWEESPRIIEVAAPSVQLKCQDLHDTLRYLAALPDAMDEDDIVDSSGKEPLGGGITVGLTVKLLNAKVRFQSRNGPETTQCIILDGTLVTDDGSTPIAPSYYTSVVVMNQVGGVIATSSADVEAITNAVWGKSAGESVPAGSYGDKISKTEANTKIIPAVL